MARCLLGKLWIRLQQCGTMNDPHFPNFCEVFELPEGGKDCLQRIPELQSLQLSATSRYQNHPSCYCSHMQPTEIPNLPQKYSDLVEAFSKIKASQRSPLYSSDCAIELLPGTTPPWGRIFSIESTWVRPSTSLAWVECRALSMHQLSRP